jgi:hypothetical protein
MQSECVRISKRQKVLAEKSNFVANVKNLVLTDALRHGWQSFLGTASQCRGLKLLRLVGHFQITTSIKLPGHPAEPAAAGPAVCLAVA